MDSQYDGDNGEPEGGGGELCLAVGGTHLLHPLLTLGEQTEPRVLYAPLLCDLVSPHPPADQPLPVVDYPLVGLPPPPGTLPQPQTRTVGSSPRLYLNMQCQVVTELIDKVELELPFEL